MGHSKSHKEVLEHEDGIVEVSQQIKERERKPTQSIHHSYCHQQRGVLPMSFGFLQKHKMVHIKGVFVCWAGA